MVEKHKYPYNLYVALYGDDIEIPDVSEEELCERVNKVLAHIKDNHRQIMLLKYKDYMSNVEIGTYIGSTAQYVSSLCKKICRTMRHPSLSKILLQGSYQVELTSYIQSLNLSTRAVTCLQRHKIYTIKDLLDTDYFDLISFYNLGAGTAKEIIDKVNKLQLLFEEPSKLLSTYQEYLTENKQQTSDPNSDSFSSTSIF